MADDANFSRVDALAPVFDLTSRLAQYPALDEFLALQKELAVLLDGIALVYFALAFGAQERGIRQYDAA